MVNRYFFWNEKSGLKLGIYEGKDVFEAYRNLLVDAGYEIGNQDHERFYLEFINGNDVACKEVEERYFISIDNVEETHTIEVFGGFEHETIENAQKVIKDLKSDPKNEYKYRIYKGYVTSFDENDAVLKAYVLEVLSEKLGLKT